MLAENFDVVSIFFGDIVDFSDLTANCTPNEVNLFHCVYIEILYSLLKLFLLFIKKLVDFMNLFCACLDSRIAKFNVYNVHTMGDEYMVVSGMPIKNGEIG